MLKSNQMQWLVVAVIMLGLASTSMAFAESESSFKSAHLTDIYLTPSMKSGTTSYTLDFGSKPMITLADGNSYDIDWIQAFYAVSVVDNYTFTATEGASSLGWNWNTQKGKGKDDGTVLIAGWDTTGGNRLGIHDKKQGTFTFGSLTFDSGKVVPGLHISYGNGLKTDWFTVNNLQPVPELSTLTAAIGVLSPGLIFLRRKKK